METNAFSNNPSPAEKATQSLIVCPTCGNSFDSKEKKCPHCGAKNNLKNCKVCGAVFAKNAKQCPNCGAKNKKPIYTKVWFWVLLVVLILSQIAITS